MWSWAEDSESVQFLCKQWRTFWQGTKDSQCTSVSCLLVTLLLQGGFLLSSIIMKKTVALWNILFFPDKPKCKQQSHHRPFSGKGIVQVFGRKLLFKGYEQVISYNLFGGTEFISDLLMSWQLVWEEPRAKSF